MYSKEDIHVVVYSVDCSEHFRFEQMAPFCLKLETFLIMNQISYSRKIPKIKLKNDYKIPYVKIYSKDNKKKLLWRMSDSHYIIHFLQTKFLGLKEDDISLNPIQHAIQQLVEESLYFSLLYERYFTKAFQSYKRDLFKQHPTWFKNFCLFRVKNRMRSIAKAQGRGRLTLEQVLEKVELDLNALEELLGNAEFFSQLETEQTKPTYIDACVFGQLANCAYYDGNPILQEKMKQRPKLMAYLERMSDYLESCKSGDSQSTLVSI